MCGTRVPARLAAQKTQPTKENIDFGNKYYIGDQFCPSIIWFCSRE